MRTLKPGRFVVSVVLAMVAVTPFGLTAQRWMTYELLGVDGGLGAWCLAATMLLAIGLGTALLVGVPCYIATRLLGLTGNRKAVTFCALASAVTAIAHRSVVPFATTAIDHAVPPALGIIFFAVFYAFHYRDAGSAQPNTPLQTDRASPGR